MDSNSTFYPNIVIFSTFKPFLKEFVVEQTNALRSWKRLRCKPKIIIIGDDEGVADVCKKENVINHPIVKKTKYGTPLVGDIFEKGWEYATDSDICVFVNGDIILTDSFCDGIERFVKEYPDYKNMTYMLTSVRFDWYNFKEIDFDNDEWEKTINKDINGKYAPPSGIDLFIHKRNTFKVPFSGIAKLSYDSWIMGYANSSFDITINATNVIKIYHQYGMWYQDNKIVQRNQSDGCKELIENRNHINDILMKDKKVFKLRSINNCKIKW